MAPSAAADFTVTHADRHARAAALAESAARHDAVRPDHQTQAPSRPLTPAEVQTRSAALTSQSTPVPRPTELVIGSIGVDMPVVPVGLDRRDAMALPADPDVAGWYRYGPAPGSPEGAAVLAAHVDTSTDGLGPLAALASVQAGATVRVRSGGSVSSYRVVSVSRVDKADIDLGRVFSRTGPGRLHVLTCGGAFDPETGYEDNVVLVAEPYR